MDGFARFDARRRAGLFDEAGARRGVSSIIIEKDFWVCWALKRLFAHADAAAFIFKGGTSLSKAFGVIRRFSEDIDVSIDRKMLGYAGDRDPGAAPSGTKAQQLLKSLGQDLETYLHDKLLPAMTDAMRDALGTNDGWHLSLGVDATIDFHYPAGIDAARYAEIGYVRPLVRFEFGARGEMWPSESRTVISYAAEELPAVFSTPDMRVNVLAAERTFWEKVTLLHAEAHRPAESAPGDRLSRHHYDLAMMADSEHGTRALENPDLLRAVAEHKAVFFKSGWASYDSARPGTLKLMPDAARVVALKSDYGKMTPMFFEAPPPFDEIMKRIESLERAINELPVR